MMGGLLLLGVRVQFQQGSEVVLVPVATCLGCITLFGLLYSIALTGLTQIPLSETDHRAIVFSMLCVVHVIDADIALNLTN